jgi:hypothetical protein
MLSIWPPRSMQAGADRQQLPRRSMTGSEAGTSYTESDTCSLRSHYTGLGGGSYVAGSISSSMWAEAASTLDTRDDGGDNVSVAESHDGYVAATYAAGLHASMLPGSAAAMAVAEAQVQAWSAALAQQQVLAHSLGFHHGHSSAMDRLGSGSNVDVGGGAPSGRAGGAPGGLPQGLEWRDSEDGEMVLEIAPLPGRLVVFLAGAVDHALQSVGPASELVSVTAWFQ